MISKTKIGAMEMSVGTIVTIVLLMSVLVLGIFLVQKIFKTGTSAIDVVDSQIQAEVNKLFAEEGKNFVIYPSSQQITLTKGDLTIGAGSSPTLAEKVLFVIPQTAPPCTVTYRVTIEDNKKEFAEGGSVFVTIK